MTDLAPHQVTLSFDDNSLLPLLYGEHDSHLARLEHQLGVTLSSRGNHVTITGPEDPARTAELVLRALWDRLERDMAVGPPEVDAMVRMAREHGGQKVPDDNDRGTPMLNKGASLRTRLRLIEARTPTQAAYIDALAASELVFGLGPAGTGKTYLAVAQGVSLLMANKVDRIILSRPAVEAGERLGFLPGDLKEKVDPYLRPLYDALYDMLPPDTVTRHLDNGTIEIAPLAFMRGRTLAHAFVILDEAQNATSMQMRMFLTRLGETSRMVVTGDSSQTDLPSGARAGLQEAVKILEGVDGVGVIRFTHDDVVRHPLVMRIVRAYEAMDDKSSGQ